MIDKNLLPGKCKESKYLWVPTKFDSWVKDQVRQVKNKGFIIGTHGAVELLTDKIIIPNNIDISKLITVRKRLPIRKRLM